MRICAVSDLHGRIPDIPACDVLIVAGDFCGEFTNPFDPDIMRARQTEWLDTVWRAFEELCPAKHILATPGNHDWIHRLPEGLRTRLFIDEECSLWDDLTGELKTFWFSPWVSPVGNWNYLMSRERRKQAFSGIPVGLDVLVCHSPAARVCDQAYDGEHCGCPELRQFILQRKPKHFCYGHIHEAQRHGGPRHTLGSTQTYCCAMFGNDWKPVGFEI